MSVYRDFIEVPAMVAGYFLGSHPINTQLEVSQYTLDQSGPGDSDRQQLVDDVFNEVEEVVLDLWKQADRAR